MADLQVPPAVGTSGQRLDVAVVNAGSTIWRQSVVIGDPVSSGNMGKVDSAGNQFMVSASSGLIQLTSAIAISSGTFTLSSNPTVNVSSGVINISSAGLSPSILPVISTAGFAPVTSSYGLAVNLLSTANVVQVTNTPTVVSASSGLIQISGTVTVLSTAASNPWSSAPGFNMPVVNASSGFAQVFVTGSSAAPAPVTSSGGLLVTVASGGGSTGINIFGSSNAIAPATSSGGLSMHITDVTGPVTSSWGVTIIYSTGAGGGVTSTFFVLTTIQSIKTGAGNLMGFCAYSSLDITGGLVLRFYDATTGNVTLGTSMKLVVPIPGLNSTGTVATVNPTNPMWFGPQGLTFGTAISVDAGISSTGTITTSPIFLSAFYL